MVTVHPGFLADIIAHPGDDVPRLIYADWLEEHGDDAQAEFIRVQVELAKLRAVGCHEGETCNVTGQCAECGRDVKAEPLRRRERELLDGPAPKLGEGLIAPRVLWSFGDIGNYVRFQPVFCRGFVAEVTLSLADWCGEVCGNCWGRGIIHWPVRSLPCTVCHGTGRTGGHGPALVKAMPLEWVMLADVSPRPVDGERGRFLWLEQDLPRCLFDLLPLDDCPFLTVTNWKRFPSKQEALDALSHACLVWAKSAK